LLWFFVLTLILALVSGCTPDVEVDEPEPSETTMGADQLIAAAQSFYDCMSGAGLPVELVENHDGYESVVQFTGDLWLMIRSPEGGTLRWPSNDEREHDPEALAMAQAFFDDSMVPGLMIDGVDHSMVYTRCLERSGYNQHAAWGSTNMDFDLVSRQIESNNAWAGCARSNGWPMIQDSQASIDPDESDWPTVLIPVTITAEELRTLVEACPTFNPEQQEYLSQWWHIETTGQYPPDYMPDPSLDFVVPSLQYSTNPEDEPTAEEAAALENISALYGVLYEKKNEYWANKVGN
jgi:hypothetical protein